MPIRVSSPTLEGPLLISKMLKLPVLLDVEEMKALLETLPPFQLYQVAGMCVQGEEVMAEGDFLEMYDVYISLLKEGKTPLSDHFRVPFSPLLSVTSDVLYALPVDETHQLIKAVRPSVQCQANHIQYSEEDHTFRSMVLGAESISWGVQFSYPQLFQDPKTQEIHPVREGDLFPNTSLFKSLQKWIRHHTVATPFVVGERRLNVPIRLGKRCFDWIAEHPQLKQKGISVYGAS